MIFVILILFLIFLYLVVRHNESFVVNPNTLTGNNSLLTTLRPFRECSPTNVQCILKKKPLKLHSKEKYQQKRKKVNYLSSKRVQDLLPTNFNRF